ncbi:hypothetical protein K8354_08415 [Polaribacter litorisediminis]|uniref:hypothetical protein n=1 Tax=Polaribacter litorisediminis TaxID=1908341 RepID=UPI001CBC797A|nr:hypothetical protein [Polaribacter litorisediminis]UAM99808.1 hypothetical protein K8354_08415 [Polaribacter litorisediminis]
MKKQLEDQAKSPEKITRKEAIQKIGNYGKYATLTALGTYLILYPKKAQAASPEAPGSDFERIVDQNGNNFIKKFIKK